MVIALAMCLMVCLTSAYPTIDNSLVNMGQASGDVIAIVQELQDKMLAEEGSGLLKLNFGIFYNNEICHKHFMVYTALTSKMNEVFKSYLK